MHHRTIRLIMFTAKNLLIMFAWLAGLAAYFVTMLMVQRYFGLSDVAVFLMILATGIIGFGLVMSYAKAKSDLADAEHEEEMTMLRLRQEKDSWLTKN